MSVAKFLDEKSCSIALKAETKIECIRELSSLMVTKVKGVSYEDLLSVLMEREEMSSTGFENGVAIPHARLSKDIDFTLGVAVSRKGIRFDSIAGKLTHLFFVLIGPENKPQKYLRYLAQLSRLGLNRIARDEIINAPTSASLKSLVASYIIPKNSRNSVEEKKKLLVIILYEPEFLESIATVFLEHGVEGATVIGSKGFSSVLTNVSLFGDFLNFLGENSSESRTIMSVVSEEKLDSIIRALEEVGGDLMENRKATVLVLDVLYSKGASLIS